MLGDPLRLRRRSQSGGGGDCFNRTGLRRRFRNHPAYDDGPPEAGKYLLSQACHPLAMRILIGVTAGWIAFYAADQALFGARLVPALPQLAKSILNGFGVYL
jgi:hypothetical protein